MANTALTLLSSLQRTPISMNLRMRFRRSLKLRRWRMAVATHMLTWLKRSEKRNALGATSCLFAFIQFLSTNSRDSMRRNSSNSTKVRCLATRVASNVSRDRRCSSRRGGRGTDSDLLSVASMRAGSPSSPSMLIEVNEKICKKASGAPASAAEAGSGAVCPAAGVDPETALADDPGRSTPAMATEVEGGGRASRTEPAEEATSWW
mmetsp:Transcript_75319/g.176817  ORF Transcript_75319/g.176817 Transcript_75319/m.176817 type:complete len:206 (+) Transcript_75319:377-994(+)